MNDQLAPADSGWLTHNCLGACTPTGSRLKNSRRYLLFSAIGISYSLNFSRKAVLGAGAAVMPCMCLVTHLPVRAEIALFSIAFFARLAFSTLVITLPADLFPRGMVGSVVGLVGFGGSMGGMLFNQFAGSLLSHVGREAGHPLWFAIGSTFYVAGFLWMLLTIRNIRPIARGIRKPLVRQPLP